MELRLRNRGSKSFQADSEKDREVVPVDGNRDIAFLRQLMEDGKGTVQVNSNHRSLLYEKEIQDQLLLKAAMKMSPDDGETLLYLGSFTKKVFDKRKPRPKDIIYQRPRLKEEPIVAPSPQTKVLSLSEANGTGLTIVDSPIFKNSSYKATP